MSDRFRTRIRTKRCPRCESLQDEANWVCDQCGFDGKTTAEERIKSQDEPLDT
jgi:NMD protein affecting ribosome stability and mRNA decay